MGDMRQRLEKFALSLHPEKTRLIEFGRFAARDRESRGMGRPETFNFLEFTHICSRARRGVFQLKRQTRRDRMQARLRALKKKLRRRMHESIPLQGKWLGQVVRGCFAYHAVPANSRCLGTFRHYVVDLWRLTRAAKSVRSHNVESDGNTRGRVLTVTAHPSSVAQRSLRRQIPEGGARCVNHTRRDLCVGCAAMRIPTAIRFPIFSWRYFRIADIGS
jgi:hypothetical protein